MTTEEKLDFALNLLRGRDNPVPINEFARSIPHDMKNDFDKIFQTLDERKFIRQGHNIISITYEGEMFQGFVAENKQRELNNKLLKDSVSIAKRTKFWTITNTVLVLLALIVALFTLFYTCNPK